MRETSASPNRCERGIEGAWIKRNLRSGEALAFFIVEQDGSRHLSHQIELRGIRYVVTGMADQWIGHFATFAAASRAGFAASADVLEHGKLQ